MKPPRPLLPVSAKLLPYLSRIDESRYYSNGGPLLLEYERKMSEHFNCGVVAVSSATAGLTACLLAQGLPHGSHVAMPSWTFPATAAAVCGAGLVPSFCDVTNDGVMAKANQNTQASIVVSPFGAPIEWNKFPSEYKYPMFIDAAAGFDTIKSSGTTLTVVSTHATKVFGTGEGGLVLSTYLPMIERIKCIINFGYTPERDAFFIGLNAKMSEYHAAVGLAELDGWPEKREKWLAVKDYYEGLFADFDSPVSGKVLGADGAPERGWASSQFPIVLDRPVVKVMERLGVLGIPTRRVWGEGVHRLKAYEHFPRTELPVTEKLAGRTLFLPMACDMTRAEQELVAQKVEEALR